MRRELAMAVALLTATGILWAAEGTAPANRPAAAPASRPASDDPAAEMVEVTAFTIPFRVLDIASEMGGVLAKVNVEEGDLVKKGQVLVELKSDLLKAQVEKSKAQVDLSKVALEAAKTEMEMMKGQFARVAGMKEKGVATDVDMDKAKLDYDMSKFKVGGAETNIRVAQFEAATNEEALKRTYILAPIDGQVFRIVKREGEAVEMDREVLRLVNIDQLFIVAYAPIKTSGRITVGMKGEMVLEEQPNRLLQCEVAVVDKVADAASGTYRVKLTLANPERKLTAGSKGSVKFYLKTGQERKE